jgi:alpha/beta superfamily hydrolase
VVHGSLDAVVPYAAALHVYENSHNSQLETIMGGDHAFGGQHPWASDELPHDMEVAVKRTLAFLGD